MKPELAIRKVLRSSSATAPPPESQIINYAATVKDITARKLAEETMRGWNQTLERRVAARTAELKQSEDRFRQLVDATFEGIIIRENGVIIDGNPQIARMVGGDLLDMIGRPITDFIAPESRALVLKRISEGFKVPYEYSGLRLDGTKVPMVAHGRMMSWQGTKARVIAMRDLTSEKLADPEQPNCVPINFNEMVFETHHRMRAKADSLRAHLTLDLAIDLPPLDADTVQLSQVVINLVHNALDACAD